MSVHAPGAAVGAAADEAHVASAAAAAGARHEPRGGGRACPARSPADDRPERSPGAAAAHSADPSPQHVPFRGRRGRAATALPSRRSSAAAAVLGLYAESAEPDAVAGLSEEPVVRDLLGRRICRLAESHHGDAVDRLGSGSDSADAHPGVDCEASRPGPDHYAVREEHPGSETGPADGDSARRAAPSGRPSRTASAAVVRQLDPAKAAGPDAAELPASAEAVVAWVHAAGHPRGHHAHRPNHRAPELRHYHAGPSCATRYASDAPSAVRQPERQYDYGQFPPLAVA